MTLAVGLAMGWIVASQSVVQNDLRPFVLAADGVLVGAVMALFTGIFRARQSIRDDDLERERDHFSALFENVPNPVVGIEYEDGTPVIRSVNPAFEAVFGYHADRARGRELDDLLVPAADETTAIAGEGGVQAVADGPQVRAFEDEGDRDDHPWGEREVTLETTTGRGEFRRLTVPVDTATDRAYVMYVDITDSNLRKERLAVLSRTLRHDMRNKLTIVEGNAELLTERLGEENGPVATRIAEAASELHDLSEKTRAIEETVSGETANHAVALTDLVEDAVAAVDARYPGADYEVSVPEDRYVSGTAALSVAIENVVENAIEHHDGDPSVRITVEDRSGGDLDLVVDDDGPGIPPSERQLITDDRDRTQLEHTSGLGLWAVEWIVTDAGGDVSFDETDAGTVVRLRLPEAGDSP